MSQSIRAIAKVRFSYRVSGSTFLNFQNVHGMSEKNRNLWKRSPLRKSPYFIPTDLSSQKSESARHKTSIQLLRCHVRLVYAPVLAFKIIIFKKKDTKKMVAFVFPTSSNKTKKTTKWGICRGIFCFQRFMFFKTVFFFKTGIFF